ncbi:MAG: hypothetical protein MK132_00795 [Lentisphaerales bacterium]|nr:hypothetical protein [Lentisphaerales bacterium]
MSNFRFKVGDSIMCNLGANGWKLGKIIALNYREDHWPAGKIAPYQVMIGEDHTLIYAPEDDPRLCREASLEDLRITSRTDALAQLSNNDLESASEDKISDSQLQRSDHSNNPDYSNYRNGNCHCCHSCPQSWSTTELFSEHYRCASRNQLKVTRHTVDLGQFSVGDLLNYSTKKDTPCKEGFQQSPTLVRLQPGISFSDDGFLDGEIKFDPYRETSYKVKFVAVSTVHWDDPEVGILRLEVNFLVEGNKPPVNFDSESFIKDQQQARSIAQSKLNELGYIWEQWEYGELSNSDTCDRMTTELHQLRELLETYPRLDGGWWWVQLGGFHMNVHKLLENKLFECELYLGYALTFGDPQVRQQAEMNLEGCYQKRLLEAARFMWNDGIKLMMNNEYSAAAEIFKLAAEKKDGWGWAVNYGDIWISQANARLINAVDLLGQNVINTNESELIISEVEKLIEIAKERTEEAGAFVSKGHPWTTELCEALKSYRRLQKADLDTTGWLEELKLRTNYWCAQVLAGAFPFPPKLKPRSEDMEELKQRLPGLNENNSY